MESLLLARHAFAGSNRDGVASCAVPGEGLTAEGVEQAKRLGELLEAEVISLGVASGLARTQETLALALAGRSVPQLVLSELNEIDFGAFADGPLSTYRAWAGSQPPDEPAPGGGESRAEAAARFARGLRLLLERPEGLVLHIGHALAVRYVIDAAQGLVPAPLMTPVEHAIAQRLHASDVGNAAALLDDWSRAPRFRDHSDG
ncbi:MAG: histidine phosphatase family protein [Gaiellaceae bacterium]